MARHQDMRDGRLGRQPALDQPWRGGRLHDDVAAGAAGELRAASDENAELRGDDVKALGGVGADDRHRALAAGTGGVLRLDHHLDARQVGGERAAAPAPLLRARHPDRLVAPFIRPLRRRDRGLDVGEGELQLFLGQPLRPAPELMTLQTPEQVTQPVVCRLQRVPLDEDRITLRDGRDQYRAQHLGIVGERCDVEDRDYAESSLSTARRTKRNRTSRSPIPRPAAAQSTPCGASRCPPAASTSGRR